MDNLLRTEFIKLKRSYMFLISILGTCVAPFMVVVASFISMRTKVPTPNIVFKQLFEEVSLYHMLIIGPPLYGVNNIIKSKLQKNHLNQYFHFEYMYLK
ncbi:ABC transporter permease, partial [Staphylococcus aureus]|nr:ABC transporter permease [Staphylococcus aureus]